MPEAENKDLKAKDKSQDMVIEDQQKLIVRMQKDIRTQNLVIKHHRQFINENLSEKNRRLEGTNKKLSEEIKGLEGTNREQQDEIAVLKQTATNQGVLITKMMSDHEFVLHVARRQMKGALKT
ncbi:unnamed protein product [Phytophthora lilii]|uniref:Unnamed protein product n=1 Tax=Phytophthora lilii TaxID=2077276 RepID=A0A9W6UFM8_9STRA|nr:unnamed protein product [Phytophthora lilii]